MVWNTFECAVVFFFVLWFADQPTGRLLTSSSFWRLCWRQGCSHNTHHQKCLSSSQRNYMYFENVSTVVLPVFKNQERDCCWQPFFTFLRLEFCPARLAKIPLNGSFRLTLIHWHIINKERFIILCVCIGEIRHINIPGRKAYCDQIGNWVVYLQEKPSPNKMKLVLDTPVFNLNRSNIDRLSLIMYRRGKTQ